MNLEKIYFEQKEKIIANPIIQLIVLNCLTGNRIQYIEMYW